MSHEVSIERFREWSEVPRGLWEEVNTITDAIRERAFRLFEGRAGGCGSDVDDWLRAEREIKWSPSCEVREEEDDFRVRMALPGVEAKDIAVLAAPESLFVRAEVAHTHGDQDAKACFCESSGRRLFQRLDLPATIDVDQVTASLGKGTLQLKAPKLKQAKRAGVTA